jgi:hypothetical protein
MASGRRVLELCLPERDQLARLGVAPGAHLRVVQAGQAGMLAGSLPDFPDLAWEDFERASGLAVRDLASA